VLGEIRQALGTEPGDEGDDVFQDVLDYLLRSPTYVGGRVDLGGKYATRVAFHEQQAAYENTARRG
jgi:hypothetical protein